MLTAEQKNEVVVRELMQTSLDEMSSGEVENMMHLGMHLVDLCFKELCDRGVPVGAHPLRGDGRWLA